MHFWINKPAGRYYGFTGRRYPATALPKTSYNRHRYNVDSRQMVATPLHRFHSLSATGNSAGPSNINNCRGMQTTIRPSNNECQNSFPVGSTRRVQPNNIPNNVTTAGNNQLILSNTTPNGTNMSLLFFSDFNDRLARFNFGRYVCTAFIVAIGYVIIKKFYFKDEVKGTELFVFWVLLPYFLFMCLYFTLCRRNQRDTNQEHHIREEHITEEHIATVTTPNELTNETIKPISVVRQNPPPPYHIAILIPPPNLSEEAPPPTYDKVVR